MASTAFRDCGWRVRTTITDDFFDPEYADRWRRLEEEALDHALSMSDQLAKKVMLNVADGYRRLAERAEARGDPKRLIHGASFGPDALKAIGAAFDGGVQVQAARKRLAEALLSVASEDSREVEVLKEAALQTMALAYRKR